MNLDIGHIARLLSVNNDLKLISNLASENNTEVYLVGGFVRDLILERRSKDIDILVIGDGIKFATELAKRYKLLKHLSIFKTFGTANLKLENYEIEFVGARKESYSKDSRNPVVESGTLMDDLERRDFTVNALAISLNRDSFGLLIDKFEGLNDLEFKILRTPLDPDITFSDDPLRMMRAVRFATQLNFDIYFETFDSIKNNTSRIQIVSAERISDELNKILSSPKPSIGLEIMHKTGLLSEIFPELLELKGTETVDNISHKDNFYHTLQVVDNVAEYSDNLWLRWAALLHDIGKPLSKHFKPETGWTFHSHDLIGAKMVIEVFKRFKLPLNEKMKYVKKMVYLHLRPVSLTKEDVTDSAFRRLIVDAGDDIYDLLLLCKADVTSKNQTKVKMYHQRFENVRLQIDEVTKKDQLRNWKNPITGEIIMETFNIKPSKEIGVIKELVKDAILEGIIHNNYEEAFEFMIKQGKSIGLKPANKTF